jgi:hypothetical protein
MEDNIIISSASAVKLAWARAWHISAPACIYYHGILPKKMEDDLIKKMKGFLSAYNPSIKIKLIACDTIVN